MQDIICDSKDGTKRVIQSMLKENTGKNMMDSGGEDGRHWQKNQDRNFESEPEVFFRMYSEKDFAWTINVYYYLVKFFRHCPNLTKNFASFLDKTDANHLAAMEEYCRYERPGYGPRGEGDPLTINTFNHEQILSQNIQYVAWREGPDFPMFVLLQVHNGADVRGGYTDPRGFCLRSMPITLKQARQSIKAECQFGHCWVSENSGYEWTEQDVMAQPLRDYTWKKLSEKPENENEPILYFDEDDNLYCPECMEDNLDSLSRISFTIPSRL